LKYFGRKCNSFGGLFEIEKKKQTIEELEKQAAHPEFWDNNEQARSLMTKLNGQKKTVQLWGKLNSELEEASSLCKLFENEKDDKAIADIEANLGILKKQIDELEFQTKLSGEVDRNNAIVSIHAGAGGTESCDWAEMLLRMYTRWADKKAFSYDVIDVLQGDEAGTKSVTLLIKGEFAYGLLQSEIGVHRLVRISPFDANKRRHTSFASVDVIPEIDDDIEIKVEDKEIRIDTYRSSGAGGQYINKTDSAVRITHLATNIVVQSQNERSQLKNRVTAMKLLKAKLYELEQEKKRQAVERHYDEKGDIAWGSQIRSYVFMPYQLVKDHRTGKEVPQVDNVMDGEIDPFISEYLNWKAQNKLKK
jgi:peptide chain release factor 2